MKLSRCRAHMFTAAAVAVVAVSAARLAADQAPPPLDAESRFQVALQHLRDGNAGMAVEEIKRAIKDDPKNPYFHKGLGVAYVQLQDYDKAIGSFRKALELNPYYTDVHNDLGTALSFAGKRDEARREFLVAFNDPTYNTPEVAARNLGQVAFEERKYDDALNWYRTSTQRNPKYSLGWLGMSDVYLALGRPEEAVLQLQAAQREVPESISVRLAYGDACFRAGRFGDARSALEDVARKDPAGAAGRRAVEMLKSFPH